MLEKVGAVLDTSPHWENLSGFQNVFFAASSYGMSRRQAEVRVKELLDRSGLKDQAHEPVGTYSFGMRRKLSLIQAFVSDPELMVLDEPTAGVDPHFMAAMTEMIRARCEAGKTTFISSNDPEWLAGTVSQVAFMEAGQIIEQGTVDELVARVSTLTEVRISLEDYFRLPDPPMAGIRSFTQTGDVATVFMDNDPLLIPRLIEWISQEGRKIRAIETLGNSLREVFLLRTGKELE
jgi:ABC-2 type transport system ATP-binding protein